MSDDTPQKHLSDNTEEALKRMIQITELTIDSTQKETDAVAMNKGAEFAQLSSHKQDVNELYRQASEEFMVRKDEFLSYSSPLTKQLVDLQSELKKTVDANLQVLKPLATSDAREAQKAANQSEAE